MTDFAKIVIFYNHMEREMTPGENLAAQMVFFAQRTLVANGLELKPEVNLSRYAPSELLEAADRYANLQKELALEGQLPELSGEYLAKIWPVRRQWSQSWRQFATEELVAECKKV